MDNRGIYSVSENIVLYSDMKCMREYDIQCIRECCYIKGYEVYERIWIIEGYTVYQRMLLYKGI